jgi:PIN domain nuclease of toxin-antitoxin system
VSDLLLDTCAVIWTGLGIPISPAALGEIATRQLHVSPISALEIGILVRRNRLMVNGPAKLWFATLSHRLNATLPPLTTDLLIASTELPGDPPNDPFDRIVIATALAQGLRIVTRDKLILAYARQHNIASLAC